MFFGPDQTHIKTQIQVEWLEFFYSSHAGFSLILPLEPNKSRSRKVIIYNVTSRREPEITLLIVIQLMHNVTSDGGWTWLW